jgi:hypothetical protein
VVYRVAPSCRVLASASCARERSTAWYSTVARYCSDVSTRLASHDDAACPRVLQVPRYARVLCNARALQFNRCSQILLYSSPTGSGTRGGAETLPRGEVGSGSAGRVVAPEPSRAGGGVQSRGTRGSTGALPRRVPTVCSLICNRNLACGEGATVDCCNVISVADEFGKTIITSSRLFFMLSCRLAPTNVAPVQHRRRTGNEATCALTRSHLSSRVGSEAGWARLLVGFRCDDTCHVASSDLGTGPAPRTQVRNLPLAPLLAKLVANWGTGPTPDPTPCLGQSRTELLRPCTEGTLVLGYRQRYSTSALEWDTTFRRFKEQETRLLPRNTV